jgi:hypothetical protein
LVCKQQELIQPGLSKNKKSPKPPG